MIGVVMEDIGVRLDRLTDRQMQILRLVGHGYTSKEIARQLDLSPSTVNNHLLAATQLLDVGGRAEAARALGRFEAGHKLPRQSSALPIPQNAAIFEGAEETEASRPILALPPLGGRRNDLNWQDRTLHILRIALVSLATLTALALVSAGLMTTFA